MRILGHLLATVFRTFWHLVFAAVVCAVLAAGTAMVVAYTATRMWPPTRLTELTAAAVAVLAAYAGALTVLLGASVKGLIEAARLAEHEAVAPLKAMERELAGRKS